MGKGDPKKQRGKMSSYAFFVHTCREEHKNKHPDASVNFSEFSKKCSERWKTMSAKEKGKFEDMAKADKVRYEREMKTYILPKVETKKKFKDPNALKRPPLAFFLFCSEYCPKIKGEHPGLSIGDVAKKLGEMWNYTAADDKQPYEKKAAKLKEKYVKDITAYRAKGKPDVDKKGGVVKAEKSKKKKEEEEDEEDEDEEEEEEDDDDNNKDRNTDRNTNQVTGFQENLKLPKQYKAQLRPQKTTQLEASKQEKRSERLRGPARSHGLENTQFPACRGHRGHAHPFAHSGSHDSSTVSSLLFPVGGGLPAREAARVLSGALSRPSLPERPRLGGAPPGECGGEMEAAGSQLDPLPGGGPPDRRSLAVGGGRSGLGVPERKGRPAGPSAAAFDSHSGGRDPVARVLSEARRK
ncbi:uncharacterized protein LOC141522717 [Macrotis lagotis]|uniref:uncharacterized protein LOC141522717 n=1 Tax=Macrotis lagotis TaxID=92651 RepID=UPI003D68DA7C